MKATIKEIAGLLNKIYNISTYYVGGCVRDEIMGIEPEDIDLCVVGGNPREVNDAFDMLESLGLIDSHSGIVGASFPVWVVTINGKKYEFALARTEKKTGNSHTDFSVDTENVTIEQDLARRDLTINAIAKNVLNGEFVDPYNGIYDIETKTACPVSDAFKEDPLRVMRAARFISRFDLVPSDTLIAMCRKIKPGNISMERIGLELKKTMEQAIDVPKFFTFLNNVGWLEHYFPELYALKGVQQDPINHPEGDAYIHTMHCLDATLDPFIRIVMLCHDLGKAVTTEWNEKKQKWQALGHEEAGAKITKAFLKRIHYDNHKVINQIACLVELHMIRVPLRDAKRPHAVVRSFYRKLMNHELFYGHLVAVVRADLAGRPPKVVPMGDLIYETYVWKELLDTDAMKPIVTGKKLLSIGVPPGPLMSKIIDHALELQDRGTLNKENWMDVLHGAGYKLWDYLYNNIYEQ